VQVAPKGVEDVADLRDRDSVAVHREGREFASSQAIEISHGDFSHPASILALRL
jgi:hypothetical protein